jgi:hypothetical protein
MRRHFDTTERASVVPFIPGIAARRCKWSSLHDRSMGNACQGSCQMTRKCTHTAVEKRPDYETFATRRRQHKPREVPIPGLAYEQRGAELDSKQVRDQHPTKRHSKGICISEAHVETDWPATHKTIRCPTSNTPTYRVS